MQPDGTATPDPTFAAYVNRCAGNIVEAARLFARTLLDAGADTEAVLAEIKAQMHVFSDVDAEQHAPTALWLATRDRDYGSKPPSLAAPAFAASPAGRQARLVCLANVAPEPIQWLWSPRLARGKITLLAGDPGTGKTYVALAITAALSRGWPLPGETASREPCSVVYMSREDGMADTLRPRVDALGGDASRVHVLDGATDGGTVTLADIDVIADACGQTHAGLIVVDPVQSWLGTRLDAHRANETRPVLDALVAVCARCRCACLVNAHSPKARGTRAVTAALMSIDFAAAARVMLIAGADPGDESRSILAAAKTNIGPLPESIAYVIDRQNGTFAWGPAVEVSAADVLATDAATNDDRGALSEAVDWLRAELASGARPATEMDRAARGAGIASITLRRARRAAGVRVRREGGLGGAGRWLWLLDGDVATDDFETGVAYAGE
jgi:hypothetical protein